MYYNPDLLSKEIDEDSDEVPTQDDNILPQAPAPQTAMPSLTEDNIIELGLKELKRELQMQRQLVSGNVADLVACLLTTVLNSVPDRDNVITQNESMNSLEVTTKWPDSQSSSSQFLWSVKM